MKPPHADKGGRGGGAKRGRGPQVGAALSLDKFASAKVSKYDKKHQLEKQRVLRAKHINKYRKLQKRLAAEGKLPPPFAAADEQPLDAMDGPALASTSGAAEEDDMGSLAMQRQRLSAHEADDRPVKKRRVQQLHEGALNQEQHLQQATAAAGQPAAKHHKQQPQQQQPVKQHQQQEQPRLQQQAQASEAAGTSDAPQGRRKHKQPRPPSQLQRLADKRQQQLAEQRQEQEQRLKAQEELKQQKQAKQKERSTSKHNFFKRTKHGQPLMKYRVDKVLQVLEREVAGKR